METKKVAGRKHSAQFRAEVLQACRQANVSVAAIALRNGLNANVVYRWLREDARGVAAGAGSHPASSLQCNCASGCGARFDRHSHRSAPRCIDCHGGLATSSKCRVRGLAARVAAVIRIDALWLATSPVDMRAGPERLLARVVQVFDSAQAHHGYLFANARPHP
ncbi:MAG: hypothetical protein M3R45_11170 [Pseudomonadota bacterium]|nr:hypothetical protein [Pseudomonadota bacterium]